ncbi:MAG: HAD family hydrolase [Anaeroplasmataceae bacterium]
MKKGIIFDCDGVLLDSMDMWNHVGRNYLLKKGIDDPNIDIECGSMNLEEASLYIKQKHNLVEDPISIRLALNCVIEEAYFTYLDIKKGVKEFLAYASRLGYKMIIATATPKPLVVAALKRHNILDYFIDVITTLKVKKSKNYPDVYDYSLKVLNMNKDDVYVFEDIEHAINTLIKNNYDVVGVLDIDNEYIYDMNIKTIDSFSDKKAYELL